MAICKMRRDPGSILSRGQGRKVKVWRDTSAHGVVVTGAVPVADEAGYFDICGPLSVAFSHCFPHRMS